MIEALLEPPETGPIPRSVGSVVLSSKHGAGRSRIDRLRSSGAMKVAMPRRGDALGAILINTSGGLTGGDRIDVRAAAGRDSRLSLTTQAAERAYRSRSGAARVRTALRAAENATLHWLPQELILFDGADLERRLDIDLAGSSEAVIVEPVVFGRLAMGEDRVAGRFHDAIVLRRDGVPLFADRIALDGAITGTMARPALGRGATALATALYHGPRADSLLPRIRALLPDTGGASRVAPDVIVIRLLAADGYALRHALLPILETLTGTKLPRSWSL